MHTTKIVDVKVGAISALPNGNELKRRIVGLSKSKDTDEMIAYQLSREGYRGCDRCYVSLGLVSRIRNEAGIKRPSRRLSTPSQGVFSLQQLARKLGVKIDWLFEQIISEKVTLEPDPIQRRFLIAADSEVIGDLEMLRNADNAICAKREAS